jgi:hypothetical protein
MDYERVIMTKLHYPKGETRPRIECTSFGEVQNYMNADSSNNSSFEYIMEDSYCKVYFDVESIPAQCRDDEISMHNIQINKKAEETINLFLSLNNNSGFKIYSMSREPRKLIDYPDSFKFSHRYYVDLICRPIEFGKQFKNFLKRQDDDIKSIFDTSVYSKNRVLNVLNGIKPFDKDKDVHYPYGVFTKKKMLDEWHCLFATYITKDMNHIKYAKDYEQINKEFRPVSGPIEDKNIIIQVISTEEKAKKFEWVSNSISKFDKKRATDFDLWFNMLCCIKNLRNKFSISISETYQLAHSFSKIGDNYDYNSVEKKMDEIMNNGRDDGYGLTYYKECLKEDDPEYYASSLKPTTYKEVKAEFEKENFLIKNPVCYASIINGNVYFNKKNEFNCIHEGKKYIKHVPNLKTGEMNKKTFEFVKDWYKDENKKAFDEIKWTPPPLKCPTNIFNSWVDFKYSEMEPVDDGNDYVAIYKEFVLNLFGDEKIANYIHARYAARFQKPAYKTKVCVVLYSEDEGVGKNTFIEVIYKLLADKGIQLDNAKKLYENHSTFEEKRLFICINEARGSDNFENADTLKTRITEDTLNVNPKNIKPYLIDNLCDYDMTTNNINVIKLDDNSTRRWFMTETTSYYAGNTGFFRWFHENIINNEVALKQIFDWYMSFDIDSVITSGNFQSDKDKPVSKITSEVKAMNRDKVVYFLEDFARSLNTDSRKISNKDLFSEWVDFSKFNNYNYNMNNIHFGKKISMISKQIQKTLGMEAIKKDLKNSTTTIYQKPLMEYIKYLNNISK